MVIRHCSYKGARGDNLMRKTVVGWGEERTPTKQASINISVIKFYKQIESATYLTLISEKNI